ncbi:MAG: glycogen/starch synthase [Spirochaetales bacterium]|nr:glycogen/starch synthase [Spirochaetales bacterium]
MSASRGDLRRGVWHVSREYGGLAEAGGLKDVVSGLAQALAEAGVPTAVVLPRYGFLDLGSLGARKHPVGFRLALPSDTQVSAPVEEPVQVYALKRGRVQIYLLDSPCTRAKRDIYTYTAADEDEDPNRRRGTGHWDAHHLNLILQRGALELALADRAPELFHCHDGHAALLPALLREHPRYRRGLAASRALVTIHNAGWGYHQEIYDLEYAAGLTGLPRSVLEKGLLGGAVDPLLLGALYAPVTTVSEGYAEEISSGAHELLTGGLGEAYRRAGVRLQGITNGIDPRGHDPRRPKESGLPHRFDPSKGQLEGKRRCRRALVDLLQSQRGAVSETDAGQNPLAGVKCYGGLDAEAPVPLYSFVGRLTAQKGLDVLVEALGQLFRERAPLQALILGQGDRGLEERLLRLSREVPAAGKLGVMLGYNTLASKYLFAAGDFFLVPSEYEPCGLTDFYAQVMGNLPIVHAVGGLVKVRDGETGYAYHEHSAEALCEAIRESLSDWQHRSEHLEGMRRRAFAEIFEQHTWDRVLSEHYLPLYTDRALWKDPSR